uniref:Uncharacterized protein n=1 Tax=Ciona savignyi TaxID=51511 RepID=H2Y9Y8_CIOSA
MPNGTTLSVALAAYPCKSAFCCSNQGKFARTTSPTVRSLRQRIDSCKVGCPKR